MNQQYVSPTNTLGKKKKKNNLVGGASAMQNISDLPEEVGYTPGPSPVGGVLGQTHGGGPGAGGPGFVTTAPQPGPVTGIVQPYTGDPESEKAYRDMYSWIGKKMKSDQELKDVMNLPPPILKEPIAPPPILAPGMSYGIQPQPSTNIPPTQDNPLQSLIPKRIQQTGPVDAGGAGAAELPEFYTDPTQPVLSSDAIKNLQTQGVVFGEGGVPDIPEGMGGLLGTGTQAQMRKEALDKVGMAGMIEPEFEDVLGTVEVGTDTIVPTTDALASLSGQPTVVGGGTVTQPPQQTQPPTPIQTGGAGAPDEPGLGLTTTEDVGEKGSQFVDFAADQKRPEGGMTLAEYKAQQAAKPPIPEEYQMSFEDEQDIRDPASQEKIYGDAAPGYQDTEAKRAKRDEMLQEQNKFLKQAAQANVDTLTFQQNAAALSNALKNSTSANFGSSPQFKNLAEWFAAAEATRATMTNPLANLETIDVPVLDALGNPITNPVTGEEQVSKELTPVSQDVLKTYGDLLANEETRNQMARQYNISNLNDIGETIDPDTGERVPTDVALSRQTALANSLSSIAGQTFTPAEAAAYERGEVSEELKTKLDASWAQVQKEQEEQINQMKSNIKLTDANAAVKLAEVTKMEGDLQLAKDELAWRKDHSAAELAERQKARDAEMGRLQAELESVATREGQQRTHERELATQSQKHQMDMQRIEQQTAFATQAMNMLANNPSAIFALQTTPGLEGLADLMGITRRPGAAAPGAPPQGMIPTLGTLQQGGQRAMQQAQTMAGIQQGLTPGEFAQQVRGVTPGGGFAPGVQQMTGITRTGRG